jgi:hypothetical protein
LIDNDGDDAVVGRFAGKDDGATFKLASFGKDYFYQIRYFADVTTGAARGGNDVLLTVVPEPHAALLAIGAGLGASRMRRRKAAFGGGFRRP